MRKRWLKLAALPIAFAFVAAACSTEDDDDGAADTGGTEAATEAAPARPTAPRRRRHHRARRHQGGSRRHQWPTESSEPPTTEAPATTAAPPPRLRRRRRLARQRRLGDGVRRGGLRERGRRDAGRPDRVRRGQRHRHHLRRPARLRAADQHPGARRQPARHRHLPAARQAQPVRRGRRPAPVARRRRWRPCRRTGTRATWRSTNVDGTQYGVPFKSDLKSLVWYVPSVWEEKGYEVPETLDRLQGAHRRDDRQRRHAALRRHRVRAGHRLAVHRLGRGADPARAGHRLLQPVGRPRGAVQRPAGASTRSTRSPDPTACWTKEGAVYAVRRVDRRHPVRRQRRAAGRRQTA